MEPTEKKDSLLIPGSILAAGVIVALSIMYAFGNRDGYAPPKTNTVVDYADDDPYLGSKDAPVTVVEFSDFQCPFCRRYWRDIIPRLKEEYINTGRVRFVYRDFPLSNIHPGAEPAALAAECADDQGKFWEMHDKIFLEQDKRATRPDKMDTVSFTEVDLEVWGAEIGLNADEYNRCRAERRYAAEVAKDLSDGSAAGVNGTPGTFVNDRFINGAVPYDQLRGAIEAELAKD